jgi:hypothetical protein
MAACKEAFAFLGDAIKYLPSDPYGLVALWILLGAIVGLIIFQVFWSVRGSTEQKEIAAYEAMFKDVDNTSTLIRELGKSGGIEIVRREVAEVLKQLTEAVTSTEPKEPLKAALSRTTDLLGQGAFANFDRLIDLAKTRDDRKATTLPGLLGKRRKAVSHGVVILCGVFITTVLLILLAADSDAPIGQARSSCKDELLAITDLKRQNGLLQEQVRGLEEAKKNLEAQLALHLKAPPKVRAAPREKTKAPTPTRQDGPISINLQSSPISLAECSLMMENQGWVSPRELTKKIDESNEKCENSVKNLDGLLKEAEAKIVLRDAGIKNRDDQITYLRDQCKC